MSIEVICILLEQWHNARMRLISSMDHAEGAAMGEEKKQYICAASRLLVR